MNTRIKSRLVNTNLRIVFVLAAILALNSCGQKPKRKIHKKSTIALSSTETVQKRPPYNADSILLFDIEETVVSKGDTLTFVSVSEVDSLPRTVDSLVIPDLKGKKPEDTQYLQLTARYRKRLLTSTGISETDSLFVYDYAKDVLLSFPISRLSVVASLSPYEDPSEGPHSEEDYMIGFEIDRSSLAGLNKNFVTTCVYIGARSPFTKGQMHPVIWEKTDPKKIPPVTLSVEDAEALKGFKPSGAYTFQSDGYHFYLREFSKSQELSERLVVSNSMNKVIFDQLYYETESSSPASLSYANANDNDHEQWTGRLFKNRPPLMLGFENISFGCPVLPYLDQSRGYVDFKCDNRH